jgi:hypothetical protein
MARPESAFLRTLYGPLMEDAREEVDRALRVALMREHGLTERQMAARLGVGLVDIRAAVKRVVAAQRLLERGG